MIVKISELVEEAKTTPLQKLADKYGVCYQTIHRYLKEAGFKNPRRGRPRLFSK